MFLRNRSVKLITVLLLLALTVLPAVSVHAATQNHLPEKQLQLYRHTISKTQLPTRVLLIGNSMTEYSFANSVPTDLRSLTDMNHVDAEITSVTHWNTSLGDYAAGCYYTELDAALTESSYNYIVLQDTTEFTTGIWNGYFNNIDNIMKLLDSYHQLDATIVLYATNGCTHYKGISYYQYEQRTLENVRLAQERIRRNYPDVDVVVAEAGERHIRVLQINPQEDLLIADGNHPSYVGFYVSAMCIFDTIWPGKMKHVDAFLQPYLETVTRSHDNNGSMRIRNLLF